MPRYTLVEHENLANFVVAVAVTPKLEARARQHMGGTFDDYAKADTAANETNDWACVQNEDGEPLYPNRVAHLTGFSSKCRVDGRRLYLHSDHHRRHRDQGELTVQEPKFNPPYGGAINHVTDPAEHDGYLHMVAWAVEIGSHAEYIKDRCEQAKAAGAPLDTLYERSGPCGVGTGEWVRFSDIDITGHDGARGFVRIEQYVRELVRYQHAVAQYRKWRRTAPPLKTFTVTVRAPITTTVRALDEEDARRTAMAGWAPSPDGTATARLTGPPGSWVAKFNGTPSVKEVRR